jgi:hypothetical protein
MLVYLSPHPVASKRYISETAMKKFLQYAILANIVWGTWVELFRVIFA